MEYGYSNINFLFHVPLKMLNLCHCPGTQSWSPDYGYSKWVVVLIPPIRPDIIHEGSVGEGSLQGSYTRVWSYW